MSYEPLSLTDALNRYVNSRNVVEDLESRLKAEKAILLEREQVLIEYYQQAALRDIKSAKELMKHADGSCLVVHEVFGSVNTKLYTKEQVLPLLKNNVELKSLVETKEDFNSKKLGSIVKAIRTREYAKWLIAKENNPNLDAFDEKSILPKELIEKLNLSESYSIRFTRTKE